MVIKMIKSKKIDNFLEYVLAFLIIIECNSVYSQIYGIHLYIRGSIVLLASFILLFFIIRKKSIKYKPLLKYIIYIYVCSFCMLLNSTILSGKMLIFLVFLIFLPLLLVYIYNCTNYELTNFLNKFINIIVVLCLISLFFWLFGAVLNLIETSNTLKVVWAKPYSLVKSYYYIHFRTQDIWLASKFLVTRNTGIFTEGPMYAVVLMIALLFNNGLYSNNKKRNILKTLIIVFTIITTISFTGIITVFIIMIPYIFHKYSIVNKLKNNKIVLMLVIFFLVLTISFGTVLVSKKMDTGSYKHRNTDLRIGFEKFFEDPIIGKGINHERKTETDYKVGYGYSNSIIPVLTDGGIVLAFIYLFPLLMLIIKSIKYKNTKYILLILIYIVILFTTLIQYRIILMTLVALIYCSQLNVYADKRDESNKITMNKNVDNLISVVVPIYNMEKYLKKCVNSIRSQTYHNLEILLIDDGSTDKSLKICKELSKGDKRIKVYHKQNGGLSDAKNYGIKKAKGDYITFVDSDDWVEKDMYYAMLSKMIETSSNIIICGRFLDYEDGSSITTNYHQEMVMNTEESIVQLNSFSCFDMSSCDKLYERALFEGIEFPYGKKCEDAYTTYRLFAKSKRVTFIPNCFYHYFQRQNSISRSSNINIDYIYAAEGQMHFINDNYPNIKNVGETNLAFCIKNTFPELIIKNQ